MMSTELAGLSGDSLAIAALIVGFVGGLVISWLGWKVAKPGSAELQAVRAELEAERKSQPDVLVLAAKIAEEKIARLNAAGPDGKSARVVELEAELAETQHRLTLARSTVADVRSELERLASTPARPAVIDLREGAPRVTAKMNGSPAPHHDSPNTAVLRQETDQADGSLRGRVSGLQSEMSELLGQLGELRSTLSDDDAAGGDEPPGGHEPKSR